MALPGLKGILDTVRQKQAPAAETPKKTTRQKKNIMAKIGVIGGSGLDNPDILKSPVEKKASTPFGEPSSPLKCGAIKGKEVVLLARHGSKHQYPPTQVNYRANMHALKQEGCSHIIATTAVGSLKEEISRGDFVIIDQFIDFTRHRQTTFFESFEDSARHTPMASPFDEGLRKTLIESCRENRLRVHEKGTVITVEGPRFSTKAESRMFRAWGADIINMSIAPEAVLANELGIPYAAIAMATDYDCWKEGEEPVNFNAILSVFEKNAENAKKALLSTIAKIE